MKPKNLNQLISEIIAQGDFSMEELSKRAGLTTEELLGKLQIQSLSYEEIKAMALHIPYVKFLEAMREDLGDERA